MIALNESVSSRLVRMHDYVELITVEVALTKKLKLSCLYIPPGSNDNYQQEVLKTIESFSILDDVILLGDFNCPVINWSTMSATSSFSLDLCNVMFSLNYVQIVSEPTHQHEDILDLIVTNIPQKLVNLSVNSALGTLISDHSLVSIDIIGSTTSSRRSQAHIANKLLLNFSKMDRIGIVDFMESSFDHYQYQSQFDNMTMDPSSCWACYKML